MVTLYVVEHYKTSQSLLWLTLYFLLIVINKTKVQLGML